MHVILSAFGTAGDTLPLIELGRQLVVAGHEVDFLGLAYFENQAKAAGLPFRTIGPAGLFEEFANDPMAWHSYKGLAALWKAIARAIPDTLAHVEQLHRPGRTVLVGTSGALGIRLAQEKLGLRCATIHMAPFCLFSRVDNCFGGLGCWPAWWPGWFRHLALAAIDRIYIDGVARNDINALRASIGLAPTKNVFTRWVNSPDRVICAVPDWFAAAQPDWPAQTVSVPFPLIESSKEWTPDAALSAFLDGDPPPIVFSATTGVGFATTFYRRAVEVGQLMRRRVILVTRFAAQIPSPLPDFALHLDHAPFDRLLPRVAAIVHHGGIGTIALAMRAGIPQIVTPFAYDQFYNGVCVERLGVGRKIGRNSPSGVLAVALAGVLESAAVSGRCDHYRQIMGAADSGFAQMVKHVEALGAAPAGANQRSAG